MLFVFYSRVVFIVVKLYAFFIYELIFFYGPPHYFWLAPPLDLIVYVVATKNLSMFSQCVSLNLNQDQR
jgi:hypothetical protein